MANGDRDWDFYLRILSNSARDSSLANDPSADPSLIQSVKKLYELCKAENSEDLVARVYPQFNKLFQRSVASISQSQSRTSNGLLLLAILQFFLDFGDTVLHDPDPSLRAFFRTCLRNGNHIILYSISFLQFFPLLLKLIAWNGEKLERLFLKTFPGLISPGSFLPLFPSIMDLPILVVALEKVERSSGSLIGSSIASIQKSTAPEMLLALMDESLYWFDNGDGGGDSESEDGNTIDVADP
ncbi:LOW QUALITY PROTEIN: AP-5 complex subunit zeta-1, partial [Carica papaya]|uniref:LOW QUALITY PROTEIN: AP-5 complex subunit zeta-1 n=1 Tax=Carica papaya TaxID=3649 RepID=UPI000B8C8C65